MNHILTQPLLVKSQRDFQVCTYVLAHALHLVQAVLNAFDDGMKLERDSKFFSYCGAPAVRGLGGTSRSQWWMQSANGTELGKSEMFLVNTSHPRHGPGGT